MPGVEQPPSRVGLTTSRGGQPAFGGEADHFWDWSASLSLSLSLAASQRSWEPSAGSADVGCFGGSSGPGRAPCIVLDAEGAGGAG